MALAIADSNGMKRICTNCGTRFYDMGKTPITCPSCNTEYAGQVKPKVIESLDDDKSEEESPIDITAGAAASKESETTDSDENEEVVSLDDIDEDFDDSDDDMNALDDGDLDLDEIAKGGDEE